MALVNGQQSVLDCMLFCLVHSDETSLKRSKEQFFCYNKKVSNSPVISS